MFVLNSTYEAEVDRRRAAEIAFHTLLNKWDSLVDRINAKGGESFLDGEKNNQFDGNEIKQLISLCHPDKHDGKAVATEMTKKLIKIKDDS